MIKPSKFFFKFSDRERRELVRPSSWNLLGDDFGEPFFERPGAAVSFDERDRTIGFFRQLLDNSLLERFGKVSEIQIAVVNEGIIRGGDNIVRKWSVIEPMVSLKRGGEIAGEYGGIDPIHGNEDALVKSPTLNFVVRVFCSEIGKISANQGFSVSDRFQEW